MRLLKQPSVLFLFTWIAAAGSAWAGPRMGSDAQRIDSFLQTVYARYTAHGASRDSNDAHAGTIYEASLLALMREDRRALQGEAGVLDADPLCACQDHAIRALKWVLAPAGTDGWSARVSFENLGSTQRVVLSLRRAPQGWRISDVQSENVPSLRVSLQEEIHAAARVIQPPATH